MLLRAGLGWLLGQDGVGPAEGRQDTPGMARVEEIDRGRVFAFDQADFQVAHEPGRRHPEVVAHRDNGLEARTVALSHDGIRFCILYRIVSYTPRYTRLRSFVSFYFSHCGCHYARDRYVGVVFNENDE